MRSRCDYLTRRSASVVVCASLAIILVQPAAGATSNDIGTDSLSDADAAVQMAQAPLMRIAEEVAATAKTLPAEHLANNVSIDVPGRVVTVDWVGEVPQELRAVKAEAKKEDITLRFQAAKNTLTQVKSEAESIRAKAPEAEPVTVSVSTDKVVVHSRNLAAKAAQFAAGRNVDAASAKLIQHARDVTASKGIAVEYSTEVAAQTPAGRRDDTNAFLGGSRYFFASPGPNGAFCTSGFQAQIGVQMYFLTAAHCSNYSDNVPIYSGASWIGTSAYAAMYRSNGYDLGLVSLGNSTNQARIYADPLSTTKTVVSSASSMVFNATYCSSGSVTLGKCNLYTSGTQSNSLGWWVVDLQRVAEFNNTPGVSTYLICQGDSGGPIFYYPGNDRSRIVAAGIVSTTALDAQVWIGDRYVGCSTTGGAGASVVGTAVNLLPGLEIRIAP